MKCIHPALRPWVLAAFLLCGGPAHAALACSIAVTPSPVKGIYVFWQNLDIQGSFVVTCTRAAWDSRTPWIWIGVDQPAAGQAMTRDIGGSTLNYFVYRRSFGNGVWTNSGSQAANSNAAGGLRVQLNFGSATALTTSFSFYFRVPWLQVKAAGVYLDAPVPVTLRANSASGNLLGSGSLTTLVSIQDNCRFSSDPTPIVLNYTAFQAAPVVRSSSFALVCTQGTDYTLALDATAGVVPAVGIAYTAAVSTSGPVTGTAVAQTHGVTVTVPANQAGRCATGSCVGTDTRTLTVTY